ncbi:hypothetical protein QT711_11255 [Sporosarcina saromensis]|uniref:Bacteriophage HK97-gp10, tail-component n=1 Tax=Sporosarcina saromensis TaxID=359365 RepID=A0ABU4G9X2_9BACL|nr:hypothetical protein [Sporosarcina saromensis]MDW0113765.1 hypothetical protein [Sporosarcina saromensis]
MADKFSFELIGTEEMKDVLDEFEKAFFRNLDKVLTKLAEKVIQDARRLAPIDSGDLEAALDKDTVKTDIASMYIDFGVVMSPEVAPYAWAQHEGFRKTKSGKVVIFTPGPKTQSKGSHKGHNPGKKYLQNAIAINEDTVLSELAEALQFGGGLF